VCGPRARATSPAGLFFVGAAVPYTTDTDIRDSVAGALGLGTGSSLPTHWTARLITTANNRGYYALRSVMLGRGYSAAQLDAWERAEDWNDRLGVLYAFLEARKSGAQIGGNLDQELKDALAELKGDAVVIAGEVVAPAGVAPGVIGFGDDATAEDRFILGTADGEGTFQLPDGSTRL